MVEKYYTPEIEEFHVGFEYEYHIKDWVEKDGEKTKSSSYEYVWSKEVCYKGENYGFDLGTIEACLAVNQIRVKYLDREDIVSLGWEHDQTTKDGSDYYIGNMMTKEYRLNSGRNNETEIEIWDISGNVKYHYILFKGIVKNKSELKKIMKMINIF